MKKLIILLAISPLFSYAQMNRLFYNEPWKDVLKVADSLHAALPDYTVEDVDTTGEQATFVLVNSNSRITVTAFKTRMQLISQAIIKGDYEALFSIYKNYINNSAVSNTILNNGGANVVMVALQNKKVPVAFYKEGNVWILRTRYDK